jgi:hypothetical protein
VPPERTCNLRARPPVSRPPRHRQIVVTIVSAVLFRGDGSMRRLDSVAQPVSGETLSAIAAAQSARVVLSLGYANGWGRTSDTEHMFDQDGALIARPPPL